jgi:hypothetical protein
MEFCVLSPVAGLERYSTLSRHHLVLPQIKNEQYRQFYKQRREKGDFIILDNGAYERNKDWHLLLEAIPFYDPDVVVLPDFYLKSWEKTLHEATTFLDHFGKDFNTQWMFCGQAVKGDIMGWIEGVIRALQDTRIKWFALPRCLSTDISMDPLIRANICRYLKRKGRRVHALGMVKGSVGELEMVRDAGCDSIDSNAPVWRGWCGRRLAAPNWYDIEVRYEEKWYEDNDELILDNLEACGVNTSAVRAGTGSGVQQQTVPGSTSD